MTLLSEIQQADEEFRSAIREQIPSAEVEHIAPILERLLQEYRKKQQEIWSAHREPSPSKDG